MLTVVGNARISLDKYCSPLSSLPDLRIVERKGSCCLSWTAASLLTPALSQGARVLFVIPAGL